MEEKIKKIEDISLEDTHEYFENRCSDGNWSTTMAFVFFDFLKREPLFFKNIWYKKNKYELWNYESRNRKMNITTGELLYEEENENDK